MPEETVVQEAPVEQPAPETPKEFRYEYQPEENGVPLGGKQVIIYDGTPEDLGAKMAAQNSELVKLNRKLKKDLRLGNVLKDEIPQNAPRFDETKFQLTPVPLSAEERIEVSRQLADPETFDAAAQRLVKSQIGDPEALRVRLARLEEKAARDNAVNEAEAFRRENPEYHVCPDNFQTLANWMIKNNLDPVKENFQLAYDNLKEYLVAKPEAPKPVVEQPVTPQTPAPKPVASGLTRSNSSDIGPAPKTGYSQAEIDKMSAEEYRQKILVPEFNKARASRRG